MNDNHDTIWSGRVDPGCVARNESQPRTVFAADKLKKLGTSMKRGQHAPCIVIPHPKPVDGVKYLLVDGERRWRAAKAEGIKLWIVVRKFIDDNELHSASLTSNFCREGHTKMEIARAVAREISRGHSHAEIAECIGRSPVYVSQHASLNNLHPELQKLLDAPTPKEDRIPFNVAVLLSTQPPFDQLGQWNRTREKSKGEMFHALRTSASVTVGRSARRTPADDAEYITGKCDQVSKLVILLRDLPEAMLKRITSESRIRMLARLEECALELRNAIGRFEA